MSDAVRKSISATLTEIEAAEGALALRQREIINPPGEWEIAQDTDAREAWEIIERIERKLFPAGMPK
jgi:hypothetical protein